MKYLNMTIRGNLEYYFYLHVHIYGIKSLLRIEFTPKENTLNGKVHVPVVLKCLSFTVGIHPLKPAHESMLPNLIMPSLNILINSPRLLNCLHVNLQSVLLDSLRK
jgi:hypothetical protein